MEGGTVLCKFGWRIVRRKELTSYVCFDNIEWRPITQTLQFRSRPRTSCVSTCPCSPAAPKKHFCLPIFDCLSWKYCTKIKKFRSWKRFTFQSTKESQWDQSQWDQSQSDQSQSVVPNTQTEQSSSEQSQSEQSLSIESSFIVDSHHQLVTVMHLRLFVTRVAIVQHACIDVSAV